MGRKLPLTSILILLASSLTPGAVWADDYVKEQWTYAEMAALNAEVQAEIDEYCKDDNTPMCHDMYIGMNKTGDIYRALFQYRTHGLTITAVNPYEHTIRVAFDTHVLSAGWPDNLHVKDLYIAQPERDAYAGDFATAIDNEYDDWLEGVHVLFYRNNAGNDDIWIPFDGELELSVPDLSIDDDVRKHLEVFYTMSTTNARWNDYFDFSSCPLSLEEGMECQIRYQTGKYLYVPVEVAKPVSAARGEDESGDSAEIATDTDTANATSLDEGYGAADAVAPSTFAADSDASGGAATMAPDTGAATGNHAGATLDFVCWFGGILLTGITVLAWLFWPKTHHKSKFSKK